MKFHWAMWLEQAPKPDYRFYGIQIRSHIIGFTRYRGGGSFIVAEVWE